MAVAERFTKIDTDSEETAFEQVERQIRGKISAGSLRPGDQLPTIRAIAKQTGLNPMTVHAAFRSLKASGLLSTAGIKGTRVREGAVALVSEQNRTMAKIQLLAAFRRIAAWGIPTEELQALSRTAISELRRKRER